MKLMIAPNGRLYAPEIGRFLSRDPQDGLDGAYTYVENAPPSHVDADGATNGTKKGDAEAQKLIKEAKNWVTQARKWIKQHPDQDIPPFVKKELVGKRRLMRLYVGFTGELKVSPKMRARLLKRIKVITVVLALGGKPVPEDEPEKPKPEKPKPEKPPEKPEPPTSPGDKEAAKEEARKRVTKKKLEKLAKGKFTRYAGVINAGVTQVITNIPKGSEVCRLREFQFSKPPLSCEPWGTVSSYTFFGTLAKVKGFPKENGKFFIGLYSSTDKTDLGGATIVRPKVADALRAHGISVK